MVGFPSTSRWRSGRCQPRGRGTIVGSSPSSRRRYSLPSGLVNDRVRRTASFSTTWPPTTLRQCGVLASSRSASQTFAPQLRALTAIFGSVGPVISTRRSTSPGGGGGTCHRPARTALVSGRKSMVRAAAISARRVARAASRASRCAPNRLCRSATKARASGVRISSPRSTAGPSTRTSATGTPFRSPLGWHPLTVARLDDFNDEPADRAAEAVRACNAAPRFVAELVAGRPYPDAETLVARAEEVARALPWDEVSVALGAHPRIGDRPEGSSGEAEASRREQSSMSDADAATRAALVEGNRAYEERFGHVFLIRAAGRSPEEMLAELRRRLGNDAAAEQAEATEQLAQITALRVEGLVS